MKNKNKIQNIIFYFYTSLNVYNEFEIRYTDMKGSLHVLEATKLERTFECV
jgi:hypothetical protein